MGDQANHVVRKSWTVLPEHRRLRVDAFVRRCLPHLSRRQIENALDARLFFSGGQASRKGDSLARADELVFHGPSSWLAAEPVPEPQLKVPVVHEDASILLVNKPAGMPTHGFSARDTGTLVNFLLARWPQLVHIGADRWQPGLVHRLDRDTSGLVVVAKTEGALADLKFQFRRRAVKKIYWALVWGDSPAAGVVELRLAHVRGDPTRMRALKPAADLQEKSWKAVTRYRTLARSQGVSWVEVDMVTGVTHQIRVHLAAIGHAIVGDTLYGAGHSKNFGMTRHCLHARSLEILHPDSGEPVKFAAALPRELGRVLRRLKIKR